MKYSAFDRDLLAAYYFLCLFRCMLEGREFTIFPNHKPLTIALFRVFLLWSAHQHDHLSDLSQYTSSEVQVPWVDNVVADALSRLSPMPYSLFSGSSALVPLCRFSQTLPWPLVISTSFSFFNCSAPLSPRPFLLSLFLLLCFSWKLCLAL